MNDNVLHRFGCALGGPRWLNCEYHKTADGYRWQFSRGGDMTPDAWMQILAEALSGTRRFGGRSLTDAKHSELICRYLRECGYGPGAQMMALIHDASEVLGAGDMNSRLKRAIGHGLRAYEHDVLEFLITDLGIGGLISESDRSVVDAADKVFGEAECRLMDFQHGLPWLVSLDNEVYVWMERTLREEDDRPYSYHHARDGKTYTTEWTKVWSALHSR